MEAEDHPHLHAGPLFCQHGLDQLPQLAVIRFWRVEGLVLDQPLHHPAARLAMPPRTSVVFVPRAFSVSISSFQLYTVSSDTV